MPRPPHVPRERQLPARRPRRARTGGARSARGCGAVSAGFPGTVPPRVQPILRDDRGGIPAGDRCDRTSDHRTSVVARPRMTQNQVQVAIIGCGRVSGHHCRSIARTHGVVLAAVCDLVEEKAAAYGKEFGVPYFVNYHEMFQALPEIDTVAVVTPSGMHAEHAAEIMGTYRKNIIMEKPTFMRPSQLGDTYALA